MAPVLGLCALLAADAVLIGWAFRGTSVDPAGVTAARSATSSAPSASPSVTGSAGAPAVKVTDLTRFVAPVGPDVAWVVDSGSCKEPGTLWVTADGGASWQATDLPGRVVRARPSSVEAGWVAGGDSGCDLRLWSTGDAGESWTDPTSAEEAWSRQPEDVHDVHLPSDEVKKPCGQSEVVDLAVLDARRARVLCRNGQVRVTRDGGVNWPRETTVKGALAVGIAEGSQGAVVRTDSGCAGVFVVPLSAGVPGRGRCVDAAPVAGQVSVASAGTSWWLVVGDAVFRGDGPNGPWTRTTADLPKS